MSATLCGILVRQDGIQGLDPELAAFLPDMDLSVKSHRERFDANMEPILRTGTHAPGAEDSLDKLYECETLWDDLRTVSSTS